LRGLATFSGEKKKIFGHPAKIAGWHRKITRRKEDVPGDIRVSYGEITP